MKKVSACIVFLALVVFLVPGSAMAIAIGDLGTEITIEDGIWSDPAGRGIALEDDEVETTSLESQAWDLEGVFWNGTVLSIVGGFDYRLAPGTHAVGDVFISDYVLDFDREDDGVNLDGAGGGFTIYAPGSYDLIGLSSNHSPDSAPFQMDSEGDGVDVGTGLYQVLQMSSAENASYFSDWGAGGEGMRYVLQVYDSPFVTSLIENGGVVHLTFDCGNDTIHGQASNPVPEPATMLLLGTGLIGMAGIGRKRLSKTDKIKG